MGVQHCISCGAQRRGAETFCTACGRQFESSPSTEVRADPGSTRPPPSEQPQEPSPPTRRVSRWIPFLLGVLAVGVIAVLALQVLPSSRDEAPSVAVTVRPPQAAVESPSSTANESLSEAPNPQRMPSQVVPAELARSYVGVMRGGHGDATFDMKLHEARGRVRGEVVWDHTADLGGGYAGTQYVKGHRDGRDLTMKSLGWSADTAADWTDEFYTYDLTFLDDRLTQFNGWMFCQVCGTGDRRIEGAKS